MKKITVFIVLTISCLLFASCFALPEEPAPFIPPTLTLPAVREFDTLTISRGDVRLMQSTRARYALVHEISVSFETTGLPVEEILVQVGDFVRAGDIIAIAGTPDLTEEQDEYVGQIEAILLRLRHATERHRTLLDVAEATGNPVDDSRNIAEIANIRDELSIARYRLERLGVVAETTHLLAPIDGTITHVITFSEGMQTRAGTAIVRMTDGTTAFLVQGPRDLVELFGLGEIFYTSVGGNDVPLVVVDPEEHGFGGRAEWAAAAFLLFAGTPVPVEVGEMLPIDIVIAEALDVVYLPTGIMRVVDERSFVYVLEDGLRQLRVLELGIFGNNSVEIISGLQEGDMVVR